jgi:hypothetical protein
VSSSSGVYEQTVVVPYWMSPGQQTITAYCSSADNNPDPLVLDVHQPDGLPWDVWRPTVRPWIVEPIPEFAAPSAQPDGAYFLDVTDGDHVTVAAMCDPATPRSGGRFIVWARLGAPASDERFDAFFATEYPVPDDAYIDTDDGVMITAEIEFRLEDYPPLGSYQDPILTALCTATPTEFEADAEPLPFPSDTIHVVLYDPADDAP